MSSDISKTGQTGQTDSAEGPVNPVYCALDTPDLARAEALAAQLAGHVGGLKIGMEFFYAHGVQGYHAIARQGLPVFLDLKLHDIPNTVASAVRALAPLAPAWLNVHAAGGGAMMAAAADAAREGAAKSGTRPPLMLAVTVLTSLTDADLDAIGVAAGPSAQVLRLAALAQANGMDGVVCSAHEIVALRAEMGPDFKLVVPGIRPADSATQDQKRVMTPAEACRLGADVLVVGRPITQSDNPAQAARAIADSLTEID